MDQTKERERRLGLLTKVGLAITCAWLLFLAFYILVMRQGVLSMRPNELGDFLAGTFAPLAFLWLVLGFFQQGIELRNSSRALWLQGEELRNSVEQQRALVETTREQLEFERDQLKQQREDVKRRSAPIFRVARRGGSISQGSATYRFRLSNHGNSCTGVKLSFDGRSGEMSWDAIHSGAFEDFQFSHPANESFRVVAIIDYMDQELLRGSQSFVLTKEKDQAVRIDDFRDGAAEASESRDV